MTRLLRTSTSRPHYAALAGLQDIDSAGPSNSHVLEIDESGSSSEVDAAPEEQAQDEAEDMALDDAEPQGDLELAEGASASIPRREGNASATREPLLAGADSVNVSTKRKTAQSRAVPKRSVTLVSGLAHTSTRQMHALPNLHHRHRAVGVYKKTGKTERLVKSPAVFAQESTTQTNAWAESTIVMDRVNKAWGFNVGPGPLWDLLEDRSWFKEAYDSSRTTERDLRPRVHERVSLTPYDLLSQQDAISYLPSDVQTTDEGTLQPPPPLACSFGPYGKQTRIEVKMFDTVKIAQFFNGSKAHVFNAGAPVWGLDWCPLHPDDRAHHRYRQYLAIGPFPTRNHAPMVGSRVQRPTPACIQIWSLGPSATPEDAMEVDEAESSNAAQSIDTQEDAGEMHCEMVLCIESGPAFELKWCPLPSNDFAVDADNAQKSGKLGIIGGTFEDGSLTFYAVPDPRKFNHPVDGPVYVKLANPLLRIELEDTCCWCFDWANSEVVAIGCTNGSIAVYNVAEALHEHASLLPTYYFNVHQSAIRSLAWVRAPVHSATGHETADNPTVIASGGYDGVECITDIRMLSGNIVNRTRDVVTAMCFSTYSGGAVTIDHENIIKAYSFSPNMLGRGHTLLEPNGPIWSLSASEHHPQIAIGVTDGSCLTTNTMRTTRRGGTVPFLEHKVYQLDYSRALGEYRMLEHFLPKETQNRPAASRLNKTLPVGTGAWPPEVGIHRVVWNDGNGLARTPLLASATGSGLCRIDWLLGRWGKTSPPYDGVEGIRAEKAGVYDEEEDESD